MRRTVWWTRAVAILATAMVVAACASRVDRADVESPAAIPAAAAKKHPYTVAVKVTGGVASGALVSDADMKGAIEAAIESGGLFTAIVAPGDAQYELAVLITKVDRPTKDRATGAMEAVWSVTRVNDRTVAMRTLVTSTDLEPPGSAKAATARGRLAIEGAARNNIANGLQEVAALDL